MRKGSQTQLLRVSAEEFSTIEAEVFIREMLVQVLALLEPRDVLWFLVKNPSWIFRYLFRMRKRDEDRISDEPQKFEVGPDELVSDAHIKLIEVEELLSQNQRLHKFRAKRGEIHELAEAAMWMEFSMHTVFANPFVYRVKFLIRHPAFIPRYLMILDKVSRSSRRGDYPQAKEIGL